MRRSYCLLSAAMLLALGAIGLAVPTRPPATSSGSHDGAPAQIAEAPAAPASPAAVEIALRRGETLESAMRRAGAERYEIRFDGDRWTVTAVRPDVDTRVVALAGEVRDSLFATVERLGERP